MYACLLLSLAISLSSVSSVSSLVVCRLTATERVTCPEDFYCCGVDKCCKLTFDDAHEYTSKGPWDDWVSALCVRTVIVSGSMVVLYAIGKVVQHCSKRCLGKFCSEESSLPRYKPLEKNSIATDIGSVSALIGTPFYQVNSDHVGVFRVSVPI